MQPQGRKRPPQGRPEPRRDFIAQATLLLGEAFSSKSSTSGAASDGNANLYSIVSMLTVCAILPDCATAKVCATLPLIPVGFLLPHFVLYFRTGRVIHRTVPLA